MGHIHTVEESTIYAVAQGQGYLGCFRHTEGEDPKVLEKRWNRFARQMYDAGLEPMEDDPHFSVTEGTYTYDHYFLREISE